MAELIGLRAEFTPEASETRLRLIDSLRAAPPRSAGHIVKAHDILLFLWAFPSDARTAGAARMALADISTWVRRLPAKARAQLDDSGISGSTSRHTFPFAIAWWLTQRFANHVEIDWSAITDSTHLDTLLRTFLLRAEEDAFDSGDYSTRDWVRLANPASEPRALRWLLRTGHAAAPDSFGTLYDAAPLPIAWTIGSSNGSTTRNEWRAGRPTYRTAFRPPPADPIAEVAMPLPPDCLTLLPRRQAQRLLDVARAALTARCREVFPITHGNRDEVWLADLGEGASVAIIGAEPRQRMSLETNYGYLLLSNGVPIGYGGVTPLRYQANTGINIFDPFRGSEAAFLWTRMLRAFRSLFNVGRFVINAYQFGEGNAEAIASGAYWFYYRLGFRPIDPAAARVAESEFRRLQRNRAYRSSPKALRALARGDLHLTVPGFAPATFIDERQLQLLAARATTALASDPAPTRHQAVANQVATLARTLGVQSTSDWPRAEREAFERLAPVVALLPNLTRWSRADRDGLVELMRAKGARQERDFHALSQQHSIFWPELLNVLRVTPPTPRPGTATAQ